MAINLEHAAMRALAELKSMPTEILAEKVLSNAKEPLAVTIRELGYLSELGFRSASDSLEPFMYKNELLKEIDDLIFQKMKPIETKIENLEVLLKFLLLFLSANQKSIRTKSSMTLYQMNTKPLYSFSNRLQIEGN